MNVLFERDKNIVQKYFDGNLIILQNILNNILKNNNNNKATRTERVVHYRIIHKSTESFKYDFGIFLCKYLKA